MINNKKKSFCRILPYFQRTTKNPSYTSKQKKQTNRNPRNRTETEGSILNSFYEVIITLIPKLGTHNL